MTTAVNTRTGEVTDAAEFIDALRDLDARIVEADRVVGELKENLKIARRHREGLVSELRAVARGERALPLFSDDPQSGV
jgi:hypothetical protein